MLVTRITDREGNVIEENRAQAKDAIRADTAYIMTSLLRGVVERGTAVRAKALKRPIAGKTGTTTTSPTPGSSASSPRCAQGCGWASTRRRTPWARTNGRPRGPAHLARFLETDHGGEADREYPIPANIVFMPVDEMGRPGHAGMPGVQMEAFVAGTEPRSRRGCATPEHPRRRGHVAVDSPGTARGRAVGHPPRLPVRDALPVDRPVPRDVRGEGQLRPSGL